MGRTRCGSWCIKAAVRNLAAWMIFRKVTVEQACRDPGPINQSVEEAINQILDGKSDAFKAKYRSIYCSQLSATKSLVPNSFHQGLMSPLFA
jgi:hypothetical protein